MSVKRQAAVFTIQQNEKRFLPVWYNYYVKHFPHRDIYILDHNSTDDSTIATLGDIASCTSNVVPVHRSESFDHIWLRNVVESFQQFLLESYDCVLFAECDEIVAADPKSKVAATLKILVEKFSRTPGLDFIQCGGFEVVHGPGEKPIDWQAPLLAQRKWWARHELYSKVLLSKVPLRWDLGFHSLRDADQLERLANLNDTDRLSLCHGLRLLHLHRLDFNYCWERHSSNASRTWSMADLQTGRGFQNRIVQEQELRQWFYHPENYGGFKLIPWPIDDEWKAVL